MAKRTTTKNYLLKLLIDLSNHNVHTSDDQDWPDELRSRVHNLIDCLEKSSDGIPVELENANCAIFDVINWVAVKDELPETDKRVLCARAETSMAGRKRISNAIGFVNKNGRFSCEMDWVDVDYWADIKPPCL